MRWYIMKKKTTEELLLQILNEIKELRKDLVVSPYCYALVPTQRLNEILDTDKTKQGIEIS